MAYYQPFNPQPALNALKKVGPKSTYPGYDELTQEDPNYPPWSAQRPEFGSFQGINSITPGPTINTGDEADLAYLANRDPSGTQPGSNQYWGSKLADMEDTGEKQRLAELSGFLNPQQAAEWGRGMETQKMQLPYQTAAMEAASRERAANIQAQGSIREREIAEQGATQRATDYSNLQQSMIEKMGTSNSGRSFNLNSRGFGIGAQPRQQVLSPALLNPIGKAHAAYLAAGETNWQGQPSDAKQVYDGLISRALATDPMVSNMDPGLIQFAKDVARDENLSQASLQEILELKDDTGQLIFEPADENEIDSLRHLLSIMTGRLF
jgi:hypothetical protein